jgi:hypothetical protein
VVNVGDDAEIADIALLHGGGARTSLARRALCRAPRSAVLAFPFDRLYR